MPQPHDAPHTPPQDRNTSPHRLSDNPPSVPAGSPTLPQGQPHNPHTPPANPHAEIWGSGDLAAEPTTLVEIFRHFVRTTPQAAALDDGTILTYAEFNGRAEALARRLLAAGIHPGERIGIRLPSGQADLYIAIMATLLAGCAYVPVDADDPDERAELVFGEAQVSATITTAGIQLTAAVAQETLQIPPTDVSPGSADQRTAAVRQENPAPTLPTVTPEHDAWIIFTSGSTGKPKGVAVTHRSAAAFVAAEARLFLQDNPINAEDRVLAGLSVAFDASCEEMWLAWGHGACLVPAPRSLVRSGMDLGPWLIARDITIVSTVPTLAALWPDEALDNVRLLIVGGEACPDDLVERYATAEREMWNTYGPTEATVVACAARCLPGKPVTIGFPLDGWLLGCVDKDGRPVAPGEVGELIIGGVGLARYLDPAKDAEKYAPNPHVGWQRCYRSGDHVRFEPDGIHFVGRVDDQVKIGGRRIELGEVDAAVAAVPGVRAATVVVQKTPAGTSVLVGYVSPDTEVLGTARTGMDGTSGDEAASASGGAAAKHTDEAASAGGVSSASSVPAELTEEYIRAFLAERLPAPMIPRIHVMDALPVTTSGKVDKKALPWPLPASTETTATVRSAATGWSTTEAWLGNLWDELGLAATTPQADFFDAGGTSLAAATLIGLVRDLVPQVGVRDLYDHPRLGAFAEYLEGRQDFDAAAVAECVEAAAAGANVSDTATAGITSGVPTRADIPTLPNDTAAGYAISAHARRVQALVGVLTTALRASRWVTWVVAAHWLLGYVLTRHAGGTASMATSANMATSASGDAVTTGSSSLADAATTAATSAGGDVLTAASSVASASGDATILGLPSWVFGWINPMPVSGWVVLLMVIFIATPLGRLPLAAASARLLTRGIAPGIYRRAGNEHLRIWSAERIVEALGARDISSAPWSVSFARALGAQIGEHVDLHSMPPVTGMLTLKSHCSIEPEVDLNGYWIDGDRFHVGRIKVGARARVGARSTLLPGATIGADAHVQPGSTVLGGNKVKRGARWAGSPARKTGRARRRFPEITPPRAAGWVPIYGLTAVVLALLPLVAICAGAWVMLWLGRGAGPAADAGAAVTTNPIDIFLQSPVAVLLLLLPIGALVAGLVYALLTLVLVRLLSVGLQPGVTPVRSLPGWRAWTVERLMDAAREHMFPVYASTLTPVWFRLLGAQVGKDAEISTTVALPRFAHIGSETFLADDTMVSTYELGNGWMLTDHTHIGDRSFLGNSGMAGPGHKLAKGSLVAVLSSAPRRTRPHSSWWGSPPERMRRVVQDTSDDHATFRPPMRLRLGRAGVEILRLLAPMTSGALGILVAVALNAVFVAAFQASLEGLGYGAASGGGSVVSGVAGGAAAVGAGGTVAVGAGGSVVSGVAGGAAAVGAGGTVAVGAGGSLVSGVAGGAAASMGVSVVATVIAAVVASVAGVLILWAAGALAAVSSIAMKWLCVQRIRPGEHPLWSPFVWLNELQDQWVEMVAAPWLLRHVPGTRMMTAYLRGLGAKIGRGAWVESYWFPEADLCVVGDGGTVSRGTVVQTHLFHDRVMSLDTVTVGAGATLGPHSVALPAAVIGACTTIGPGSLVMRGDRVPARSRWQGNPVEVWG